MADFEQQHHDLFLRLYVDHEESLRSLVRSVVLTTDDSREMAEAFLAQVEFKRIDFASEIALASCRSAFGSAE